MFHTGVCLVFVVLVNPGGVGHWLAPLVVVLETPAILGMAAPIRLEMARLLLKSYDFWFFTTANTLLLGSLVIAICDIRTAVLLFAWALGQCAILVDAQIRDLRHLISAAACITILFYLSLFVLTALRLTDAIHDPVLFEYARKRHVMTTRDLMLNSIATVVAFYVRIYYRKWVEVRALVAEANAGGARANLKVIKCTGYYCKVKLSPLVALRRGGAVCIEAPSVTELPPSILPTRIESSKRGPSSAAASLDIKARRLTQLRHSKLNKLFRAKDTVWPRVARNILELHYQELLEVGILSAVRFSRVHRHARRTRRFLVILLYVTGLTGLAIPAFHVALSSALSNTASSPWLPVAGLVATSTFCGAFLAFYQRQLLLFLCTSFNFVFLSLQVTAAHVCVMDFFSWDAQRVALACTSWLWIHWVLTLDALTPVLRQALSFRISSAVPVLLAFIAMQVRVLLELVRWENLNIVDHVLFSGVIDGRRIEMRVVPFFLSRVLTTTIWGCRVLWRMLRLRDANCELVVITGQVEFVYDRGTSSIARLPRVGKSVHRKWRPFPRLGKVAPFVTKKDRRPSKEDT